ncbi:MAG: rhodanese-like domain-containing protein [Microbacteriaceae bacterium]|nr:rhodanese-like domain-containing protein [Microbacteriaceae bacterium]
MSDISVMDVYDRLKNDEQIVDVREADEVAAGMIPGAVHIPLGELPQRLGELDRERPVIAVCRSGGRSAQATLVLQGAGFAVDNMLGGMMKWLAAGMPIAK